MLFGIDNIEERCVVPDADIQIHQRRDEFFQNFGEYKFTKVSLVTEEEMFSRFKKNFFIGESVKNIRGQAYPIGDPTKGANIGATYFPNSAPRRYLFPTTGCYIIPKLFGYFPFLDCDDNKTYEDAKVHLNMNDIPYVAYESSYANKHWIFCDKQMPFDQTLAFIESYPHDHRYTWISQFKEEFVVRALPKNNRKPKFVEDNLVSNFTDDFKFWIQKFDKYWERNLILNFIMTLETMEKI